MFPNEASRSIAIDAKKAAVNLYLSDPANLVEWTKFFLAVLGREGRYVRFQTQAGDCTTHIDVRHHPERAEFLIESQFSDRTEQALMESTDLEVGQQVAFCFKFPPKLPEKQREAMLKTLEGELVALKRILESGERDQ